MNIRGPIEKFGKLSLNIKVAVLIKGLKSKSFHIFSTYPQCNNKSINNIIIYKTEMTSTDPDLDSKLKIFKFIILLAFRTSFRPNEA
jgi:hypothetical protein